MKTLFAVVLTLFVFTFTVCNGEANPGTPMYSPTEILKSNNSFISYIGQNLNLLSEDLTAYDTNGKTISKLEFLKQLTTGRYLFLRLNSTNGKVYFKLYNLTSKAELAQGDVIYAYTRLVYDNYQRVGKKFPAFDFTDINGKKYTSENTKGKVLVIKYWFIGCSTCVQEMPDLNKLVQRFKKRNDILFISIAPDSKEKLQTFFKRRRFDYINVYGQHNLISNILNLEAAPTHLIINKQGGIVNVVDNPDEIDYTLKHDL
jgi:peroxiredoxin